MATIADMQAYNMLQRIGPMNEGLAMGKEIPPGKGGSPGQPYDPPKPTGPYVPAPGRELAMDMKDAVPRGGFLGMKRTNVIVNDGGEAYIIEPNGNFKFDGFYDPVRHGPMFPGYVQNQSNDDMKIGKAPANEPTNKIAPTWPWNTRKKYPDGPSDEREFFDKLTGLPMRKA